MINRTFSALGRRMVAAAVLLTVAMPPALAQNHTLDGPRASGAVGERFDGFAEARDPSAADMVAKVNAERRAVYSQRATADNAPVEAVGRIYAQEIIKSAPPKTWFRSEAGTWTQK
jgi:uncharacterized protein YdbL (DUF1318 family)